MNIGKDRTDRTAMNKVKGKRKEKCERSYEGNKGAKQRSSNVKKVRHVITD